MGWGSISTRVEEDKHGLYFSFSLVTSPYSNQKYQSYSRWGQPEPRPPGETPTWLVHAGLPVCVCVCVDGATQPCQRTVYFSPDPWLGAVAVLQVTLG